MTPRQVLLGQLSACHDKNTWFVSMHGALAGLDAAGAAWKPGTGGNSIWQILNHVHFWTDRYLRRFREQPLAEVGDNASTFAEPAVPAGEAEWKEARARFDLVMNEWTRTIQEAADAKLESPARKESPEAWYTVIANMALHAAHHVGQIVTLRKLQGSWDPSQGVS